MGFLYGELKEANKDVKIVGSFSIDIYIFINFGHI